MGSKRIATLWDKKDESEEREGQAYYAGGSEHSGQQILGPGRGGGGGSHGFVEDLFNVASQSSSAQGGSATGSLPITFWQNGFTIGDDGDLREYESENNRQFLECLKRGETPPELASRLRGGAVDVKLVNKAHEEYKPASNFKAFSGTGHRLGNDL